MPLFSSTRRRAPDAPKPTLRERLAAATGRRAAKAARPAPAPAAPAAPASPFDDPATVAWFTSGGLVPFPAAAPRSFVKAETAIRLEAGLLLERARAEFARQYAARVGGTLDKDWPGTLAGRLEAELRIPELEAAAREPLPAAEGFLRTHDADDRGLADDVSAAIRLRDELEAMHKGQGMDDPYDTSPVYRRKAEEREALMENVIDTGSGGLAGLRAKGRLFVSLNDGLRSNYDLQCRIAESLVDDVMRLRPASVSGRPDPILAVIADSRLLLAAVDAAASLPLPEGSINPRPEHVDALDALNAHRDDTLLGTVPQTAAGCLALASYAVEFARSQQVPLAREEGGSDLLELMADCPEGPDAPPTGAPTLDPGTDRNGGVVAGSPLMGFIDVRSATMSELVAIQDAASIVGSVADMAALRCCFNPMSTPESICSSGAHKMMNWLSDALVDVQCAAEREAERRTPADGRERTLRLAMIATPIIESDDPDRIAGFGRDVAGHAVAEER